MFTDPPLGRVGMNEREARATGRNVSKATVPMSAVTRAQLEGEVDGLVSILVDTESERFVGAPRSSASPPTRSCRSSAP